MTTETKKVRWGVLVWARIARENVIPAIRRAANSEFHALASREPAKLSEARDKFNVPVTHDRYEDLLADPTVDAVYIPLPNALHCEWTIKAAERGKHVLCEKPIALNAAECRRMIAASAANGVRLMEGFMYRYTNRTRQVLEVLRSGALGEIKFVSSTHRFLLTNPASIKLKPELGGGALYDVGCYPVVNIINFRQTAGMEWRVDPSLPNAPHIHMHVPCLPTTNFSPLHPDFALSSPACSFIRSIMM